MSARAETTFGERRKVLDLLDACMSAEYNSFIGHALGSNPYVDPAWERDLDVLEKIREDENGAVRSLLSQMGRYRAGPTVSAFRYWKTDLNYLGLDFLVVRAAAVASDEVQRVEAAVAGLPEDIELRATFASLLAMKKRHLAELSKLAKTRGADRDSRRAASRAVTDVPLPGAPKKAAPAAAKAPPRSPGSPPLPPGAPKPPGVPKLPPGFKLPGGGAKPPGPPSAPKKPSPGAPPLPPGFKPPG